MNTASSTDIICSINNFTVGIRQMNLNTQRGQVQEMSSVSENGTMTCRINDYEVILHPALAKISANGDEVLVAGKMDRKKKLKAYALNNIEKRRISSIDSAFYILVMGVGFFLSIYFGVVAMKQPDSLFGTLSQAIAIAGLVVAGYGIRIAVLINKATNYVSYP